MCNVVLGPFSYKKVNVKHDTNIKYGTFTQIII